MSAIRIITDEEDFIVKVKNCLKPDLLDFINELSKRFQPQEPTEFLTRKEVCVLLKIDQSTLFRWRNEGVIVAYGIQNRVYFKRKEIEELINKNRLK